MDLPADSAARGQSVRAVATGLLLAMAALYLAIVLTERSGRIQAPALVIALGFARAFAEAAMVGGLADWFAVTALFRHPLGLPIPHTAIIQRNKDRIGDALAAFLRTNFFTPAVVARRMRRIDFAEFVGRFLTSPRSGDPRVRAAVSRLATGVLDAMDQERLGGMMKSTLRARLTDLDLAPLLGQALSAALLDGRHRPLIDGCVRWAARTLEANQDLVRDMIRQRANSLLRWTGLDETIANKILDGLTRLLAEMEADPDHRLRAKAEEGLAHLAVDLQSDPATQAQVNRIRDEILDNPALRRWLDGLWEQARGALMRAARDPDAALTGHLGELTAHLGETLLSNAWLASKINRFIRRTTVGLTSRYGASIVKLVSETIRGWDARTVTNRLESAVGRDLQYIRINGTLVGGLVGLLLHAIGRWL